jgi:hypothetical protein
MTGAERPLTAHVGGIIRDAGQFTKLIKNAVKVTTP